MRVLVTGASGFIGCRTVARFSERGHEIRTCGRGREIPSALEALGVRYSAVDYLDVGQCETACAGIDAVVHCAGKGGTWGTREAFHAANAETTRCLLEGAKRAGVGRFVNLSSPSIQFDYRHQLDLPESYVPSSFSNAYAETKYRAEREVSEAHGPDLLTVSLRPRGVIGPGDTTWLPVFIRMRKRNALKQVGDGQNLTNFTSVANLLDAIELCLHAPEEAMGEVYNIHNGVGERLWEVVERGLAAVGLDGSRKTIPLRVAMPLARLSEAWHRMKGTRDEPALLPVKVGVAAYSFTLDLSKALEQLGYSPRVTTDEALSAFADWWRSAESS